MQVVLLIWLKRIPQTVPSGVLRKTIVFSYRIGKYVDCEIDAGSSRRKTIRIAELSFGFLTCEKVEIIEKTMRARTQVTF